MSWLERQAERPALRPLARLLAPLLRRAERPARFVWDRVTPGDLGLELTTLLAIAAVGSYTFVAHIAKLDDGRVPIGDADSLSVARELRTEPLVEVAKLVTHLGSLPAAALLVVVTSGLLLSRREVLEAIVLVVGLALTYVGVHVTKAALDRPRPDGGLVETDGSAYISGHAAYAVTWLAVAVAIARVLPGVASRFALLVVGLVIAVLVGLTRIYLNVHYLSDVTGGWGLAATIFSTCAMVALIVAHLRDNPRRGS